MRRGDTIITGRDTRGYVVTRDLTSTGYHIPLPLTGTQIVPMLYLDICDECD